MKYRKKPVVIDAIQWNGNNQQDMENFITVEFGYQINILNGGLELKIPTLEGMMTGSKGDFIIKGVSSEFYPCKPGIFNKTYEIAE